MPPQGFRWRHVNFGTLSSWLPGDKRGWRSRGHKRHSSGDYKNPPPADEHEGLRKWSERHAAPCVTIPNEARKPAALKIAEELHRRGHQILSVSVSGRHAHALVLLPNNIRLIRRIVGDCKKQSSKAIGRYLPGRVWAAGGNFKPVDTVAHQAEVYNYILDHLKEGAWVWTYRMGYDFEAVLNDPLW